LRPVKRTLRWCARSPPRPALTASRKPRNRPPNKHGGETVYGQRAIFHPRGLAGHLYWWSVTPFHTLIFGRMLRNVAITAERDAPPPEIS
jgi:hypothetical protein